MPDIDLKYAASKIKIVIFDVDGVMTDGSLTFDEDGKEYKTYNAKDGQGIVMLNKAGFKTAIITARETLTVTHRFNILGMHKLYQGQKNKEKALEEILKEYGFEPHEAAYMGDDLPDICVLKKIGFPSCPNDAVKEVKEISKFISSKNGGSGAIRELCDFLLSCKNN